MIKGEKFFNVQSISKFTHVFKSICISVYLYLLAGMGVHGIIRLATASAIEIGEFLTSTNRKPLRTFGIPITD